MQQPINCCSSGLLHCPLHESCRVVSKILVLKLDVFKCLISLNLSISWITYIMYTLKPVIGGHGFRTSLKVGGGGLRAKRIRNLPRNQSRSVWTQSSSFKVFGSFALLLHFIASFQLESVLDSESILEAHMSSGAIHRRFASGCMGCTAHSKGCGEPTFFNDYKSAAVHYSHSSFCNKSMRRHRSAEHTPPASWRWRGRRRRSTWRMAPPTRAIRSRRCHNIGCNITKSVI
jgi:hypothetical protein